MRALFAAIAIAASSVAPARGGGGPENVFVVVNSASWASLSVANHFVRLRNIPPTNVCYLEWNGDFTTVSVETARDRILIPALDAIERRGLLGQIDYIVYSSDFPYAVDLATDFPGVQFPKEAPPVCSLNSATYFWNLILAKLPQVVGSDVNQYMRSTSVRKTAAATHGFRSWYGWGANGQLLDSGGQPFMLSTMLAYTSGRGTSVSEAVDYLKASAGADGTRPKGTIYFTATDDVRTLFRAGAARPTADQLERVSGNAEPLIAAAKRLDETIAALKELGVSAKVINTAMPHGRDDVQGAMTGVASFRWAETKSRILPGAICDNFTSFGGILAEGAGQTPLTEFLKYGAAGSSGTIVEPYAWPETPKFASPNLQVHYARGCTLAEAYYQSVFAPAQLLIVGDPLCRPWANIPQVKVEGVADGDTVKGKVSLVPSATLPHGGRIAQYVLFVDGRLAAVAQPDEDLEWDSTADCDGYHELRVVAIEAGPIESQGRTVIGVTANNYSHTMQFAARPAKTARWEEPLRLRVRAAGMTDARVHANGREIGRISGAEAELEINPRGLGYGPVTIYAVSASARGVENRVAAKPLELLIEPNVPLPAVADAPRDMVIGLVLRLPDGQIVPVQETSDPNWPVKNGLKAGDAYELQGWFHAPKDDVYQFQVWHYGELRLGVDNSLLYDGKQGDYSRRFGVAALATGWHRLTVTGRGAGDKLQILFGGPGAKTLEGKTFFHPRAVPPAATKSAK